MLPFFRKIRLRLARDNQFFKYSRYAIGEIVLVVIGILIALYINNWNERRKDLERFDQALVEVEKELIFNITSVRTGIYFHSYYDSIYLKVLIDTLQFDDYKGYARRALTNIGCDPFIVKLQDKSFSKMPQVKDLTPEQDSILIGLNSVHNFYANVVKDFEDDVKESALKKERILEKYDWFRDWQFEELKDEVITNYFLRNPEHLNSVSVVYKKQSRYNQWINNYDRISVSTYRKLHKYLNDKEIERANSINLDIDVEKNKHYLGKYDSKWCSDKNYIHDDSIVISLEKGQLIYTGYRSSGPHTKMNIIPITEHRFRSGNGGFYHLELDNHGKVEGIRFSAGPRFILTMKKVR
ncbi:DUF6090 family protein [Lutimonas zeaxanthinifaciens]|uniref:DUF6090 family protein n=1 Tax=Lutimonas zeaxanthinifaciens TaxID=3060215 RepID=UPI00265CF57F|nr:DUF6090 family protein [Lutimonas sp. YSD2104]WKK66495.1 DUF6090 family protein [Lutimonas sp. YSD2104]